MNLIIGRDSDTMKNIIVILLIGFSLLIAGCAQKQEVPKTVLDKYENLVNRYSTKYYLGTELSACTNGNETNKQIYYIRAGEKSNGETHYYGEDGSYVGNYTWIDEITPNDPKPPIDITNYDCKLIKKLDAMIEG
ncbi:MAG: hypothetical protein Q7S22_05025 [Candidatus Micrarchaeota archaeon]|nr:hypothetical protein [Candidatus Micrarchaeota archaeon]